MTAAKLLLPALLALSACATVIVGREFDLQAFRDRAQQGVTTRAEIRAWLGAPAGTGVSVESSGERYEQWTYYHGTGRIPGMRDAHFSILQMKFDPQGRLRAWNYPAWRSGFYGARPAKEWLAFCARRFTGLEINATHYRLQRRETLRRWREAAPRDFRFALKAHRYLTHYRRLREPLGPIRREREHAAALGSRLAVVLWQLPGRFGFDLERLEAFARALRAWRTVRHAIEFRHASWFQPEVAACLARHRIAVCQSDAGDWPRWDALTTDLVYVRLHGRPRTYASAYGERALRDWARRIRRWLREHRAVHVYFDNDARGAAPRDALRLLALLAPSPAPSGRGRTGRPLGPRGAPRARRARHCR